MKRLLAPLAVGIAALYLVLAVGAAGCLFLHDAPTATHHHHQSHMTHSALCAWACQVNPTAATLSNVPSSTILGFISLSGLFEPTVIAHNAAASAFSRAPPLLHS